MERPRLNDATDYPTDAVLARELGRAKAAWDALTVRLADEVPDAALEWRYYTDGKAWLAKLVRKKKTVAWLAVFDRHFKVTCYFTAKDDAAVEALAVDPGRKRAYRSRAPAGKLRPFVIEVRARKDLDDVFTLLACKLAAR